MKADIDIIDTTVTFTLEILGTSRTRLRMHQVGFHGLAAQLTRRILAGGYPRILGQRLPAWLDQRAGSSAQSPTGPPPGEVCVPCAEGWRAYQGVSAAGGTPPTLRGAVRHDPE
jgi:hypothetical protein